MQTDQFNAVLTSIDKDIESHNKKAQGFLDTANGVLAVAVFFAILYLAPGIAERALPSFESDLVVERAEYQKGVVEFKKKFGRDVYYISKDKHKELKEAGRLEQVDEEAYRLGVDPPKGFFIPILKFVKALKVEDSKMESLSKIIPLILGGVLAGFLLTYRFHMQAAKDFTLKKIELLSYLEPSKQTDSKKE